MVKKGHGRRPLKVPLFGNSYSARNDMPGLIAALAAARGRSLDHHLIQAGRASLRAHWNAGLAATATREAVDFLVTEKKLSREDAYLLASAAVDFRVTQVVDGVKGVHGMIPKSLFTAK